MNLHKRQFLVCAFTLGAVSLPCFEAFAGTQNANLAISATIAADCTISTTPVAFGTYDPIVTNLTSPLDATGTVTTTCTSGATPWVGLGQGSNPGGGSSDAVPVRQMTSGGSNYLAYALYQQTGRTTTWGNTSGSAPSSPAGNGSAQVLTVYARIPGGQNVPTGTYTDTVVATVNF